MSDRMASRLAAAWGATHVVEGGLAEAEAQLRGVLPGGATSVIDAVGADATRALALRLVRPGGRIVYIGLHAEQPLAAGAAAFAGLVDGSITMPKIVLRPA